MGTPPSNNSILKSFRISSKKSAADDGVSAVNILGISSTHIALNLDMRSLITSYAIGFESSIPIFMTIGPVLFFVSFFLCASRVTRGF